MCIFCYEMVLREIWDWGIVRFVQQVYIYRNRHDTDIYYTGFREKTFGIRVYIQNTNHTRVYINEDKQVFPLILWYSYSYEYQHQFSMRCLAVDISLCVLWAYCKCRMNIYVIWEAVDIFWFFLVCLFVFTTFLLLLLWPETFSHTCFDCDELSRPSSTFPYLIHLLLHLCFCFEGLFMCNMSRLQNKSPDAGNIVGL